MSKKGNHCHSKQYVGNNDVVIRKERFDYLCKTCQDYNAIMNSRSGSSVDLEIYNKTIKDLQSENKKLHRELDETIDYYKNEMHKSSKFRIDQIVPCYNNVLSKLYYGIFDFDDIEELRLFTNNLVRNNIAKLKCYGIETQVFVPGDVWEDSDITEEPTFIWTEDSNLDNTICNCNLFGLSLKDDYIPSILAKIEVYKFSGKDGAVIEDDDE